MQNPLHPKLHCRNLADRSSGFASRFIPMTSLHAELCKNTGRQECYRETIERRQVTRSQSAKYGENHGEPLHFSSHRSSKIEIDDHALGPARASSQAPSPLSITLATSRSVTATLIF